MCQKDYYRLEGMFTCVDTSYRISITLSIYQESCHHFAIGILILNLVCRDEELKQSLIQRFFTLFEVIFSIDIPASVNEVLVCSVQKSSQFIDCFSTAGSCNRQSNAATAKKEPICGKECESLVTDFCTRMVEEKQRSYVKEEILYHLSHVKIHQL